MALVKTPAWAESEGSYWALSTSMPMPLGLSKFWLKRRRLGGCRFLSAL